MSAEVAPGAVWNGKKYIKKSI